MRSRLATWLVCGLVGVVMSMAGAWAIAALVPARAGEWSMISGSEHGWSYWIQRDFGTMCIHRTPAMFKLREPVAEHWRMRLEQDVPMWSNVRSSGGERAIESMHRRSWVEEARGWPMLALRCETLHQSNSSRSAVQVRGGWRLGSNARGREILLPLQPIWSGLALNAAFFGMLALAARSAPMFLVRRWRAARNRCWSCGYRLDALPSAVCPECGETARRCGV